MKKLVKNIDKDTKECGMVFVGTDTQWAISQGFVEREVEQSYDERWFLKGKAPQGPEPSYEELRSKAYPKEVDQLDKLYHDIDSGLFGEEAKTSSFYLARKEVKEKYPKD